MTRAAERRGTSTAPERADTYAAAVSPPSTPTTARHDHVCRLVHGDDGFREVALGFLSTGLTHGERLLYVAERDEAALAADLSPLGDVDDLVASGSIVLLSAHGLYEPGGTFDGAEQVTRYRELTGQAVADGFSGLRVAADATAFAITHAARRHFVRYELAVDRLMSQAPMSALCAYDVTRIGAAAGELCAVHPEDDAPPELSPGFRLCFGSEGLRLSGELDLRNTELLETALSSAVACSDERVVIETSGLAFIDVRSMATLDRLRRELRTTGRDLVLTGAPPLLRRWASLLELDLRFDEEGPR